MKKLWQWAEGVTPTLSYSLLVSQDKQSETAWHMAAEQVHIKILEKLWDWVKVLWVHAGELNNVILLAQDGLEERSGTWRQKKLMLRC